MLNRIFTPFPTLATERLTLRQLVMNDRQGIFALRSNSEINKYLDRQPSKTLKDAENFINKINDTIKKNDSIYWAITLTDNNTFVGTICLLGFSDQNDKCEIGYELLVDFQGQGIMKEAIEKVIEYCFQTMQLQTIEAYTHKDNQRSAKLLEKSDFIKSPASDNPHHNYHVFTLVHSNWQPNRY
ncbi:GNAT family N-acetyltransferase [Runella sp.]|uniref:GNAT family N-acetyltransferase n=1 Tax=Runella sp. TaxID=1960881 RepID=UPI003D0C96D9